MHGWALVLLFGFPALLGGLYFGKAAHEGYCIHYLVGPIQCGPSIYILTFLGICFFAATIYLAYLWRD